MASQLNKKTKSPKASSKTNVDLGFYSPRSSPSNKKLSDVARKIRDCCANLHASVERWASLNQLGIALASKLVNYRLQREHHTSEDKTTAVKIEQDSSSHLQEVIKSSQELSKIHNSLVDVYKKMNSVWESFNAIQNLNSRRGTQEFSCSENREILFNTWTVEHFCKAAEKIRDSFCEELCLKGRLVQELNRCRNRNKLMVYLSLWLHEPYLEEENNNVLESMLIEVELR